MDTLKNRNETLLSEMSGAKVNIDRLPAELQTSHHENAKFQAHALDVRKADDENQKPKIHVSEMWRLGIGEKERGNFDGVRLYSFTKLFTRIFPEVLFCRNCFFFIAMLFLRYPSRLWMKPERYPCWEGCCIPAHAL